MNHIARLQGEAGAAHATIAAKGQATQRFGCICTAKSSEVLSPMALEKTGLRSPTSWHG